MPPPPTKKSSRGYHHGDLRRVILDAAVSLAAERGVHGLSLRECARRAGVSHAAPYRHFADKNALLVAIAEEGFAELTARGRAAMEGLTDPRARLDAYGVAYVRFAAEKPVHFRVMFSSELDVDPDGPERDSGAFALLVEAAAEAIGTNDDEAALVAGFANWCVPHGLAMLLLDGRIPAERVETPEQIEALARTVLTMWRAPASGD